MTPLDELYYPLCLRTALHLLFEKANIEIKSGQEWIYVVDRSFFDNPLTNFISRSVSVRVVPFDCPVTIVESTHEKMIPILKGGVDVDAVKAFAGAILPVPGGIMPVVLALAMRNVLIAFRVRAHLSSFHLHK